jgi:hypothetical protein
MSTVMSRAGGRWLAAAVTAGALALTGLLGAASPAIADTLSISGTLLDPAGSPAVGADVEILTLDQDYAGSAVTDDAGHWEYYDLAQGQYKIQFYYDGVTSYAYGKADFDHAEPITIGETAVVVDDQALPPTRVTGLITDAGTKKPVAGICTGYAPPTDPSDRLGGGCSGADGKYSLDVPPGHWVVVATDDKGKYVAKVTAPFDIAAGKTLSKGFALSLGGGVRGTVVDRITGKPLSHICPYAALGHKGAVIIGQAEKCSDRAGKWSVRGLPADKGVAIQLGGDKTHVSLWATNAASQQKATLFTPKVGKLTPAGTVKLHHGAVLTGKITTASGAPVVGAWVELGTASNRCGAPCNPWNAKTDKTGTYKITNIEPQKSVVAVSAYEQPLATAFSGGVSNPDLAKKVNFTFDGHATFKAVMQPEAKLQVTVTGDAGTAGSMLDAFSPGGIGVGQSSDLMTPSGTVTLDNLPGAKVKLKFTFDGTERTIWYDNATTLKKAKAIKLTAGKTAKITIAVP